MKWVMEIFWIKKSYFLLNFENENEKIGIIGLILVTSGLVGAVVCGFILDRTKQFK